MSGFLNKHSISHFFDQNKIENGIFVNPFHSLNEFGSLGIKPKVLLQGAHVQLAFM